MSSDITIFLFFQHDDYIITRLKHNPAESQQYSRIDYYNEFSILKKLVSFDVLKLIWTQPFNWLETGCKKGFTWIPVFTLNWHFLDKTKSLSNSKSVIKWEWISGSYFITWWIGCQCCDVFQFITYMYFVLRYFCCFVCPRPKLLVCRLLSNLDWLLVILHNAYFQLSHIFPMDHLGCIVFLSDLSNLRFGNKLGRSMYFWVPFHTQINWAVWNLKSRQI